MQTLKIFQVAPSFLSEIAPVQHKGDVNIIFQLSVTIGILLANLVNYFTSGILKVIPANFLFIGSLLISETPASLIERNHEIEGLTTLKKIRVVQNVDLEFEQIKMACERAQEVKDPLKKLMKHSNMPLLIIVIKM